MSYYTRQNVIDSLRLSLRQSYRLISPSRTSLVSSSEIIDILNRSRRGIHDPVVCVPGDLRTPDEMAEKIGCVTAARLIRWTRRKRNVPPHFRINKLTTRFSESLMLAWLDENTRRRK